MGTYSERRFKRLAGSLSPWQMNVGGAARQTDASRRCPFLRVFLGYPFCRGMLPKGYSIGSILRLGSPRAGYGREACMKRVLFALATGLLSRRLSQLIFRCPPHHLARRLPTYRLPRHSAGPASILVETWRRMESGTCRTPWQWFTLPSNNAVFTGGGQVGGNWQMGALVLGVEGQFDWLANQNNASAGILIATWRRHHSGDLQG